MSKKMKFYIVQPWYSQNASDLEYCFDEAMRLLGGIGDDADVIVLPESCDVPVAVNDENDEIAGRFRGRLMQELSEAAKRCGALVFANFSDVTESGLRNTTFAFDKSGEVIGKYDKAQLAPSETRLKANGKPSRDDSYARSFAPPYTLTVDGVKYAFMTCYDFYCYESYARIALEEPDVIIGCSHQRTDSHDFLETIGKFLTYNTNAWLVRSSVTLGEDSPVCGGSMIVSPKGEVLVNMLSRVGTASFEFDPHDKYVKPAGFNGAPKPHFRYIEDGRRPWLYRNAGPSMRLPESLQPYPRVCAHRGFNVVAPENTMPAYGAAVALGAEEIEFDLWTSKDGVLVSAHDCDLSIASNGTGMIWEYDLADLRKLDFGGKFFAAMKDLKIPTFEDILREFAGRVIMNIHVKIWDVGAEDDEMDEIAELLHRYDCADYCYVMSGNDEKMAKFHALHPEIKRCLGAGDDAWGIVDRAIALGIDKVQLFKPFFDDGMIAKAKAHGIRCNVFYADDPEEARRYVERGIDCVLTNDYLAVSNAIER